jgi:mRNA interferase MazF
MPTAKPGDIWVVDLGMAAKIRPCFILTRRPASNELDVFTIIAHTTSLRGNHWGIPNTNPAS